MYSKPTDSKRYVPRKNQKNQLKSQEKNQKIKQISYAFISSALPLDMYHLIHDILNIVLRTFYTV